MRDLSVKGLLLQHNSKITNTFSDLSSKKKKKTVAIGLLQVGYFMKPWFENY